MKKKVIREPKIFIYPRSKTLVKFDEGKAMGGNQTQKAQSFGGLPPPPFAANMRPSRDDKTFLGQNIIRLPVKVLGSIGSLDKHIPWSSKGGEYVDVFCFLLCRIFLTCHDSRGITLICTKFSRLKISK